MPRPKSAESRCSTMRTSAGPLRRAVQRWGPGGTFAITAGICGWPGRSARTKTMPLPAGAGRQRSCTG